MSAILIMLLAVVAIAVGAVLVTLLWALALLVFGRFAMAIVMAVPLIFVYPYVGLALLGIAIVSCADAWPAKR